LRILLLNQCFYPDVVATAQHLTDLARGLADRGHEVTVITSDRGYDDPSRRFPHSEVWKSIKIIRIRALSLGKETKLKRALNFGSFLSVCALRLLTLRRFDVVVALTSPPLISFLAALFVAIRGGRFCFWVMDLNPDEAIAAGWLKENTLTAQLLKRMLNYSLRRADRTIVLDRFMKDRVLKKGIGEDRISVLAPWSHDDSVSYSPEGRAAFRRGPARRTRTVRRRRVVSRQPPGYSPGAAIALGAAGRVGARRTRAARERLPSPRWRHARRCGSRASSGDSGSEMASGRARGLPRRLRASLAGRCHHAGAAAAR